MMICVVIPYFQRQPGILAKALHSVFRAEGVDDVRILVVDDGSPIPAKEELATLGNTRFQVDIIEQPNSGPGAARNTGLSNLPEGTQYVAFLDSDDEWLPHHLANALTALNAGFDCYFSDFLQLGAEISAFRRSGRIRPEEYQSISGRSDLHVFSGDMANQVITANIIGTPTVVFDSQKYSDIRFRVDLKMAGEDYLFWLDLALRGANFSFGSTIEIICGKGVNIFAGSGWGTENHARRIIDELSFRRCLLTDYSLNELQRSSVKSNIRNLRDGFVRDFIHRLRHRKQIGWKLFGSAIQQEPKILLRVIPVIAQALLDNRQSRIK